MPGNQTCAANNQRAYDPANPAVLLPSAFIGNLVPGTGSQINGMVADGYPGHAAGRVLRASRRSWRRRASGSPGTSTATASRRCGRRRASSTRSPRAGRGKASSARRRRRSTAWSGGRRFDDIENFATSDKTFVETPINAQYAGGETRSLEKSYNLNVTYQRDIGFSTTAEVAYVGSWTYAGGRTEDINRPVNNLYLLADPSRMFNGNALDTNLLRTNYPGMGSINQWIDAKDGDTVNNNTLRYNAMQVNVQRRLNRGLQMGLAYTLAKGEGWTGYNPDFLEADPDGRAEPAASLGADGQQPDAQPGDQLQLHDPERRRRTSPVLKWILRRLAGLRRHEVPERGGDAAELQHQQHGHRQHEPDADAGRDGRLRLHG